MKYQDLKNGRFYWEDCFDAMKEIPNGVVDMILCDLPYGTTQNKWDSVLPLDKLWVEYWRASKENAAIVLTAQTPFDKSLGVSGIDWLKYEWIWNKSHATGHLNSKKMPMKEHENILVFYKNLPTYNPQFIAKNPDNIRPNGRTKGSSNYGKFDVQSEREQPIDIAYPKSIIKINTNTREEKFHPTQKPVALFEYIIKTYTNENDLVLDNCAGSGTTAIAAINTKRRWICIEKEEEYANKAIERIIAHK